MCTQHHHIDSGAILINCIIIINLNVARFPVIVTHTGSFHVMCCWAVQVNWQFKLYVDGNQQALLVGTPVSQDTRVTVGVYNRHGWVAPLDNAFNPPETTAYFRRFTYVPRLIIRTIYFHFYFKNIADVGSNYP